MDQTYTSDNSPHDRAIEELLAAVPDPRSRAELHKLARLLNTTCNTCTTENVQKCKNSIINDILPSGAKTSATFRYLTSLATGYAPKSSDGGNAVHALGHEHGKERPAEDEPFPAYQRLHILYIIQDVLETLLLLERSNSLPHHLRSLDFGFTISSVKSQVTRFFRIAACHGNIRGDEVGEELLHLVGHWNGRVFDGEELEVLKGLVNSIPERPWAKVIEEISSEDARRAEEDKKAAEERHKWTIPYRHSVKDDPDAPWHELPAANGLYMKSTRGYPLRAGAVPRGGYDVKDGGQEADSELKKDITWLYKEMLHCFDDYTNSDEVQDIDALGNKIWKDPERPTRNYWGFTYDGIEKARENSRKFRENAIGYDDIVPLRQERVDDVDSAVARARALAGGRGGFDNRGGPRGRAGGRGGWRGPPRGSGGGPGGGYRGGRGGRYY